MTSEIGSSIDDIGPWSEVKLDIIKEYAKAYSTILSSQTHPRFHHVYIDGFAGSGENISRSSGKRVLGSALKALQIDPPFREYHFVENDSKKISILKELVKESTNSDRARVHPGDCNDVLTKVVFPRIRFKDFRRALCLLDPYGMHWDWEVIRMAGEMRSIEVFFNFPIMAINRNVLRNNPTKKTVKRFTSFWGDETWRETLYQETTQTSLFGEDESLKVSNQRVVEVFRSRIKSEAGFEYVSEALPMRNTGGTTLYFLLFASQKPVAVDIVKDIFRKYRSRGL